MEQMKNKKCIVFAGTSEGRLLYEFCTKNQIDAVFCVATEYGKGILCKLDGTRACTAYIREKAVRQQEESGKDSRTAQKSQLEQKSQSGQKTDKKREDSSIAIAVQNKPQGIEIRVGRMDAEEMAAFFQKEKPMLIIDATHPYAIEVTGNIRKAVETYRQEQKIEEQIYYRVLRNLKGTTSDIEETVDTEETAETAETEWISGEEMLHIKDLKVSYHEDITQAVAYLQSTEGNILATIGSKQAGELCKLKSFEKRVYLRILPNVEMLSKCLELGFLPDHMICMQGPFSEELNELMLREHDIKYLLTKQSGETGGYPEKVKAARACGAELVVLIPPQETEGVSVEQMCEIIGNAQSRHSSRKGVRRWAVQPEM